MSFNCSCEGFERLLFQIIMSHIHHTKADAKSVFASLNVYVSCYYYLCGSEVEQADVHPLPWQHLEDYGRSETTTAGLYSHEVRNVAVIGHQAIRLSLNAVLSWRFHLKTIVIRFYRLPYSDCF